MGSYTNYGEWLAQVLGSQQSTSQQSLYQPFQQQSTKDWNALLEWCAKQILSEPGVITAGPYFAETQHGISCTCQSCTAARAKKEFVSELGIDGDW